MGMKIMWIGLTLIMVADMVFFMGKPVGQVLMIIGLILYLLDK